MATGDRQGALVRILREQEIGSQEELARALKEAGFETTQSSISRDLKRLGVIKVDGRYRLPGILPGESNKVDRLTADTSGETLIVLKTSPGNAQRVAWVLDNTPIPGLVGTVAGDDTIFVAVRTKEDQMPVMKKIFQLF